jgi:hypothetical protein
VTVSGFSRGDPARPYLPPIMDAVYGYQALNVEAQSHSLSSPLNWMRRLINVWQSPEHSVTCGGQDRLRIHGGISASEV